jgi:hypothetical protein
MVIMVIFMENAKLIIFTVSHLTDPNTECQIPYTRLFTYYTINRTINSITLRNVKARVAHAHCQKAARNGQFYRLKVGHSHYKQEVMSLNRTQ